MELPQFKEAVAETTTLLKALRSIVPDRVDEKLITYLEVVQESPVGLEILRNAIGPKKPA